LGADSRCCSPLVVWNTAASLVATAGTTAGATGGAEASTGTSADEAADEARAAAAGVGDGANENENGLAGADGNTFNDDTDPDDGEDDENVDTGAAAAFTGLNENANGFDAVVVDEGDFFDSSPLPWSGVASVPAVAQVAAADGEARDGKAEANEKLDARVVGCGADDDDDNDKDGDEVEAGGVMANENGVACVTNENDGIDDGCDADDDDAPEVPAESDSAFVAGAV
jgi:hypothetical protein